MSKTTFQHSLELIKLDLAMYTDETINGLYNRLVLFSIDLFLKSDNLTSNHDTEYTRSNRNSLNHMNLIVNYFSALELTINDIFSKRYPTKEEERIESKYQTVYSKLESEDLVSKESRDKVIEVIRSNLKYNYPFTNKLGSLLKGADENYEGIITKFYGLRNLIHRHGLPKFIESRSISDTNFNELMGYFRTSNELVKYLISKGELDGEESPSINLSKKIKGI